MNIIALLSLALLTGTPMLQGAEGEQYKREREAKRASQARNLEAEVTAAAAEPVTSAIQAETTEIQPPKYPKAQLRLKDLQAKIERLGQEALSPKEREALSAQGKDVGSAIRIAGLKLLSDEERELYDLLMFGGLAEVFGEAQGLQGMICEYLTGWHEVGQFKGHEGVVNVLKAYQDKYDTYKTKLVTGGQDGSIKIWDVSTQTCEYTLRSKSGPITALTVLFYGPKKSDIVAVAYGTTIELFILHKKGRLIPTGILHDLNALRSVTYLTQYIDADRNILLRSYASPENSMRDWNITTRRFTTIPHVAPLLPHGADKPGLFTANYVNRTTQCLALPTHIPTAFSDMMYFHYNQITKEYKQELFASGDANGTIYIWDIKNPGCVATLHGHTAKITALQLIHENTSISKFYPRCTCPCPTCKSDEKGDYCYESHCQACKKVIEKLEEEKPYTIQLISASEDGTVRLWEMSEGTKKLPALITQEKEWSEESDSYDEGCGCADERDNPCCACTCHAEPYPESESDTEEE